MANFRMWFASTTPMFQSGLEPESAFCELYWPDLLDLDRAD